MTTNGIRLAELLPSLMDAGLQRLNISIDTLQRDRFANSPVVTGWTTCSRGSLRPLHPVFVR